MSETIDYTGAERIANDASRKLVPGFGGRISAALVWDGTDEVRIPASMGIPSEGQMVGTARERLVELAGRICYDSLGTGRKSEDYHANIVKINHGALWEHAALTIQLHPHYPDLFGVTLLNRPGVFVRLFDEDVDKRARVTINPRVIIDWNARGKTDLAAAHAVEILLHAAEPLAPHVFSGIHASNRGVGPSLAYFGMEDPDFAPRIVEPETDEEKWITLYLTGSRGWSHELVRHGDWTAISQRSTRYVDESESEWVLHPLLAAYLSDEAGTPGSGQPLNRGFLRNVLDEGVNGAREIYGARKIYDILVRALQPWLESKGVDKFSARKQARGAARGMLGNGLETEVIFSANVAQWMHMIEMRAADAADGEIRLGFVEAVLPCLRASRYGDRFNGFELAPAKDGIGRSLAGGGHK